MLNNLRRKNPKKFYRKLKKIKKPIHSEITIEQFEEHFSKLMIKGNISTNDNNNVNLENIFEELVVTFTEVELDKCGKVLKKNKSVGTDNIINEYILTGKTTLIPVLCKLLTIF